MRGKYLFSDADRKRHSEEARETWNFIKGEIRPVTNAIKSTASRRYNVVKSRYQKVARKNIRKQGSPLQAFIFGR